MARRSERGVVHHGYSLSRGDTVQTDDSTA
jgi:hypothetical protein